MKATEARIVATEFNTNDTNSQYADVIKKIALHAKKGDFNIYWYESFSAGVKEKLIKDGYTVGNTSYDQRDGSTTKINW